MKVEKQRYMGKKKKTEGRETTFFVENLIFLFFLVSLKTNPSEKKTQIDPPSQY